MRTEVLAHPKCIIDEGKPHQCVPKITDFHWLLDPRNVELLLLQQREQGLSAHRFRQAAEHHRHPIFRLPSHEILETSAGLQILAEEAF